jgi:hypothetical protein
MVRALCKVYKANSGEGLWRGRDTHSPSVGLFLSVGKLSLQLTSIVPKFLAKNDKIWYLFSQVKPELIRKDFIANLH